MKRMPRAFKLLGFTEDDWESWQEFKGSMDEIGDVGDLIEEMRELNVEIRGALQKIDIMSQMFYMMHPREYAAAANAIGVDLG